MNDLINIWASSAQVVLAKCVEMLEQDTEAEFAASVQGVHLAFDMQESEDRPGQLDLLLMEVQPDAMAEDGIQAHSMATFVMIDGETYYSPTVIDDAKLSPSASKLLEAIECQLNCREQSNTVREKCKPRRKRSALAKRGRAT